MLIKWGELNYNEFDQYRESASVVINFASTEQHSLHLPVGTDAIIGGAVTEQAARLSVSPILLLPQVYYGYSPHHRFAPGYITISQNTLFNYACEICESVIKNGFRQLFIVNSHGGNKAYLSSVVNDIGEKYGNKFSLIELNYWDIAGERIKEIRESMLGGTGHAGEFETSIIMHLCPDLVREDKIEECPPVPGNPWFQRDLLGYKKYQKFTNFNEINPEGHVGQPHMANPKKGKLFYQSITEELAKFFDYFSLQP